MNYFVITSLGKQVIPMLKDENKDDEAAILEFLRRGSATREQIADNTLINQSEAYLILMRLKRERWVKERRSKGTLLP